MTTEQIIAIAKEKLGKTITAQEAQDYSSGKAAIPDEALSLVSGGKNCMQESCTVCGSTNHTAKELTCICNDCGNTWRITLGN